MRGKFRAYATTPETQHDPAIQSISNLRSQMLDLMKRVEELENGVKGQTVTDNIKTAKKTAGEHR